MVELSIEEMVQSYHYPVMYKEVLELLEARNKRIVVDCTVGVGSCGSKLFECMRKEAFFIGIDRDADSLEIARQRLKLFGENFVLYKDNFINLDRILKDLNIEKVDIFLFDLGISTYQLNNSQRGFSFLKEGPLDMRLDKDSFLSAYDLINNLSEEELANIFKKFGEERYSRRIAHSLTKTRKDRAISTTTQLAEIIADSVPPRYRYQKIHPATRVFQSLRIAVNRELEALRVALAKAISFLDKGGKIGVISFHSLEDRIVKQIFRDQAAKEILKIITKKPLVPTDSEKKENPSSRSAKLRVAEKI